MSITRSGGVEESEISDDLRRALEELPPNLRSVLVLSDVYDLSHQKIGKQLGISATAVKVRLHRSRKRIRQAIQTKHRTRGIRSPSEHDSGRCEMRCDRNQRQIRAMARGETIGAAKLRQHVRQCHVPS